MGRSSSPRRDTEQNKRRLEEGLRGGQEWRMRERGGTYGACPSAPLISSRTRTAGTIGSCRREICVSVEVEAWILPSTGTMRDPHVLGRTQASQHRLEAAGRCSECTNYSHCSSGLYRGREPGHRDTHEGRHSVRSVARFVSLARLGDPVFHSQARKHVLGSTVDDESL